MSKAACSSSKLTRRAAIAATLAGVATPVVAAPSPAPPDPVFAAIAAHKAAYKALDQACLHMSRMESAIPNERREEWFDEDRAAGVGTNDDPRWTAALVAYRTAADAETRTAWALARVQPAGLMAAAALLRYAYEYQAGGCEWPDGSDNENSDDDWDGTFYRNLANALDAMA